MALKDHSIDNRIIVAARKEFYEYGFTQASLRKIASRAEVTTGALYTRYKNKDELFEYRLLQYCLLVCFDKKQSRILQQIGNILHIACEPCK